MAFQLVCIQTWWVSHVSHRCERSPFSCEWEESLYMICFQILLHFLTRLWAELAFSEFFSNYTDRPVMGPDCLSWKIKIKRPVNQTTQKPGERYCTEISQTGGRFLTHWPINIYTNMFTHSHTWIYSWHTVCTCSCARMYGDPDSANFPATTLWNVICAQWGWHRNQWFVPFIPSMLACWWHVLWLTLILWNTWKDIDDSWFNERRSAEEHRRTHHMEHARSLWCWILESWITATSLCDVSCSKIYLQWLTCHTTIVVLCIIQSH